jgi:hypothetical protein
MSPEPFSTTLSTLRYDVKDGVAHVVLDRPEVHNARVQRGDAERDAGPFGVR